MRQRAHVPAVLAGVALLVLALLLVPGLRSPAVLLAGVAGLGLLVTGLRVHRPPRAGYWIRIGAVLALLFAAQAVTAVTGRETAGAVGLVAAAHLAALSLVPSVLPRRPEGRRWPRMTADTSIATAGAVLLGVQVALIVREQHPGAPLPWWLLGRPALDAFALMALVHLLLTRRALERSAVLALAGGAAFLLQDLLVVAGGQLLALPGDPAQALAVAGALLLGLAAVQPDMRHLGDGAPGRHVRSASASARLLTAMPAFLTAPVLWFLGLVGLLPSVSSVLVVPGGYLLAGTGLTVALVALRRAERTAERDPLTDLVNRRGLQPAVEELRRRLPGERLYLCLVDLDDFKQVNDTRGHEVGDRLLVEVGHRLQAAVGERGVVSRTGGDEFLVVMAESGDDWGAGDTVLTALDPPFDLAGVPTLVPASVGIVALPHGTLPADVIADADVAMYAAKQAGKGRALTYRPDLRDRVLGEFEMLGELRALLDGADSAQVGRLVVLYQPIVALERVRVTGAEALVRWQHPRLGLLTPDAFLHLVEDAKLGARLDELVMQEAARQLAAWDAEGLPRLSLSLNLGIGSMRRPNLSRTVSALVERHGLTPDRFHLEITEHDELPVESGSASAFEALAGNGFQISLDDFGVGYTSLTYLRRFPVSVVKLDKSLTSLIDGPGEVPLMEGIAALCRALDVKLLAEGVQNAGQVLALRALGVEFAQGFFFSEPLPAETFAALLHQAARDEGGEDEGDEDADGRDGGPGTPALVPAGRAEASGREEDDTPAGPGTPRGSSHWGGGR